MTENRTIHLVEIPIGGKSGLFWNRLHGEREDICEALVKNSDSVSERREQLQARLRKIDDALDRLMSGSYGNCSKCGRSIDDAKLDMDPALATCSDCSKGGLSGARDSSSSDVALESLSAFDTLMLQTHNSEYRILLLDPMTGRSLVEGGDYLDEPSEALVRGSAAPGSAFKPGSICVGGRLEMWVNERAVVTSPIKSIELKHNAAAESLAAISEALHR
jgi:RNA polymerase-binding transcription factor DksA